MMTVSLIISIAAFVCAILAAIGKCPLWVSVILLCVWCLLQSIPK